MSQIVTIGLLSFFSLLSYLISLTPAINFLPQLIATITIIALAISRTPYFIYPISLVINLIVFGSGGVTSPVFFLVYFLLLVIAFDHVPSVPFAYSLVLIILLGQSLNSLTSLVTLSSLTLIAPIAWFIGQNRQQFLVDETNFLMWLSLKFKASIAKIIDSSSLLLSHPNLPYSDKEELKIIKSSAKNLLNSANHFLDTPSDNEN